MADPKPKRKFFHGRGFTSLLLSFSFIIAATSGIALYLSPATRASRTLWGLSLGEWSLLHMNSCAVLLLVSVEHILYNWHALTGYIAAGAARSFKLWKELLLALAIAVFLVIGTIQRIPPWNIAGYYSGAVRHSRAAAQAREKAASEKDEFKFKLDDTEEFDEDEFFGLPETETPAMPVD